MVKFHYVITSAEAGTKLFEFLKIKLTPEYSGKAIKHSLDLGQCEINGRIEKFGNSPLRCGDQISFHITLKGPKVDFEPQRVLYEDQSLFIYNKPAGISCDEEGISFLKKIRPHLRLVHRLDKYTTGVLIFAKNPEEEKTMLSLFKERKVGKEYLCLVDGIPKKSRGRIESFLAVKGMHEGGVERGSSLEGEKAVTDWSLIASGKNASLILCRPETGRTHQIRIHMSEMGHPILGDVWYAKAFQCSYKPPHYLLHAWRVSFKGLQVEAPLPEALSSAILSAIGRTPRIEDLPW